MSKILVSAGLTFDRVIDCCITRDQMITQLLFVLNSDGADTGIVDFEDEGSGWVMVLVEVDEEWWADHEEKGFEKRVNGYRVEVPAV